MLPRNSESNRAEATLPLLLESAVAAAQAESCLPKALADINIGNARSVLVLGAGKAAAPMAVEAERHFRARGLPVSGLVTVPYGHLSRVLPTGVEVVEASHPHPDEAGIQAARRQMQLAAESGKNDIVVFLASGGGSALLPAPVDGVSLADKRRAIALLMDNGARIADINCVRKHLSAIKGGRLAKLAQPSRVVNLVISDIPGDNAADVGSGPAMPDTSTLEQAHLAIAACKRQMPDSVLQALTRAENETPKADELGAVEARVVACAADALDAAAGTARSLGWEPVMLGDDLEGPADELARQHAQLALEYAGRPGRWALLSGGETTVTLATVPGQETGKGGRNTEYLAALALALDGHAAVHALAADTDGIDGVGGHAGALITPSSLSRAREASIDWADHRACHCTRDLFDALGDLIVSGPTLTNVNDFRVILVDTQSS